MAEATLQIKAAKREFLPLLSTTRKWYDAASNDEPIEGEGNDGTNPPTPTPTPAPASQQPLPENLVNVNAEDSEGNRLFFERDYVTSLRDESKTNRLQAEAAEAKLVTLQQAETDRKAADLTENKKWEDLAELRNTELTDLRSKLAQAEFTGLQSAIGAEYNLPAELHGRLQGTTRDEIVEDAQRLAAMFVQSKTKPESQGITPVPDSSPPPARDDTARSEEYFKGGEKSGIFTVDPDNLRFFGKE